MQISEQKIRSLNLRFLLCGTYTLKENHKIFKQITLKKDIYLNINLDGKVANPKKEFYDLLNSLALRRFAYILVKPILLKNPPPFSFNLIGNKKIWNETILLKKYLRKFKHNYRKIFFFQNGNFGNLPTEKEMNTLAIKFLFLVAGI